VPGSKSHGTISKKWRFAGSIKKITKSQNKIFEIFFLEYYIFSTYEALIHSIWTINEKVMDNLSFLGNLSVLLKK